MRRILNNLSLLLLGGMVFGGFLYVFLVFSPKIESILMPVAGNFKIYDISINKHSVEFRLLSEHFRSDCKLSTIMFFGFVNGRWNYLPANFIKDNNYIALVEDISAISGKITYRCPFEPWLSIVEFGPFALPANRL